MNIFFQERERDRERLGFGFCSWVAQWGGERAPVCWWRRGPVTDTYPRI